MSESTLIEKAHAFAAFHHLQVGQLRKYTNAPYIEHPMVVARLVEAAGGTDEMIAAAWLHDTVEDTHATIEMIHTEFGGVVGDLVSQVTDVSRPEDGNRAERKAIDRRHIANASPQGQTIKLADMIDNTMTIVRFDPNFAKVYLAEKQQLMGYLQQGHPLLYWWAESLLESGMRELFLRRQASNA